MLGSISDPTVTVMYTAWQLVTITHLGYSHTQAHDRTCGTGRW